VTAVHDELRRRNRAADRVRAFTATLVRRERVRPNRWRLTYAGPDLVGFEHGMLPGDAVKFALRERGSGPVDVVRSESGPPVFSDGTRPLFRAYTIRRFNPETTEMEFDVVVHGTGLHPTPGTRWVRDAELGDEVTFFGPRMEFWCSPQARAHLLVGDDTALPAIAAITETLPSWTPVQVFALTGSLENRVPFHCGAPLTQQWFTDPGELLAAVAAATVEVGTQCWVAAETDLVKSLRRNLVTDRGLPRADVHLAGYWKRGLSSTESDEATMDRVARARAEGRTVHDHHEEDDLDVA
jgi:NADPH-dependent ferric siderophore reductase